MNVTFFSSQSDTRPALTASIVFVVHLLSIEDRHWTQSLSALSQALCLSPRCRPQQQPRQRSNPLGCCSTFLLTSASLPPSRQMTSVSASLSRLTLRTNLLPISSELGWLGWRSILHVSGTNCSVSITTSLRRATALSFVLARSSCRSLSLGASCSPMMRTAAPSPSIVPMRVFTRVPF